MGKALRFLGVGLVGLVGLVLLAVVIGYGITEYELRRSHAAELRSVRLSTAPTVIAEGRRLTDVLGCTGCHGTSLQGKKFISEPLLATIYAANLTRALPRYTDQQLEAAIRQGIRRDGTSLTGMPSSIFANLSDEQLAAVMSYLRTIDPAGKDVPRPSIGVLGRFGLLIGQFKTEVANVKEARTKKSLFAGQEHERGRYIASVTCAECHNFDLDGIKGETPNLALAGAYNAGQFEHLMRTGEGAGKRDLGLMSKTARGRFSKFTPEEVEALHSYLVARAERLPPEK